MTAAERVERQLPGSSKTSYLGPSPEYLDELLAVAAHAPATRLDLPRKVAPHG